MGGVEYQVTKVDPTDPHTKGAVYQVHEVSEEVAATLGGKVYRARIINDPTAPTVAGKVYQIVLIGDPSDPAVKGKVYNAILTGGGSEAVIIGPALSPLSLPDAVANSLAYVKAFGGAEIKPEEYIDSVTALGKTEQRNLPKGYVELEYIEASNESQYITTNIIPDWTTEIDAKFRTGNNKTFTVLSRWTNSPTADTFGVIVSSTSSNIVSYFGRYSDGLYHNDTSLRLNANQDVEYKLGQSSIKINTHTYSITRQNLGFENVLPLWIFKGNFLGEANNVDPTGSRVYSLKIKTQGALVFNGVPAKNASGVVGLYDKVSGQFLTNAGTGELIAGPAVTIPEEYTPIDYVYMLPESHLLTDVVPVYNGHYEFDFQTLAVATTEGTLLGGRTEVYGGLLLVPSGSASGNFIIDAFDNTASGRFDSGVAAESNTRYKFVYNNQVATLYRNDTSVATHTFTGTNSNSAALCIKGRNDRGTVSSSAASLLVYSFKAWDSAGNLIADYIPCRRQTTIGFYDSVSGQFLTATAGTWTAGPVSTKSLPNPDKPVDIWCNNGVLKVSPNEANYISKNVVLGRWLNNSDGQPSIQSANFYTNMMPVKPNVSYVCFGRNKATNEISNFNRIAWYDANGVWIRNSTYIQSQPGIDVAPNNAAFARFHCNINGTDATQELIDSYNWVFQQGIAEVSYKPTGIYTDGAVETITDALGNTATAEILLNANIYTDEQDIISGQVTRNLDVKVFNGTENWTQLTNNRGFFYGLPDNDSCRTGVSLQAQQMYCTHFNFVVWPNNTTPMAINSIGYNINGATEVTNGNITIRPDTGVYDTVEKWKAFLAEQYANGTPVIVVRIANQATESVAGQVLKKEPLTVAGALEDLTVRVTSTEHTTPTPDYPLEINSNNGVLKASTNEFDASAVTNGYFYNADLEWVANSLVYTTDYMKTVKGKYTLTVNKVASLASINNVRVNLFNANKEIQSQVVIPITPETTEFTYEVDIPDGIAYVRISTNPSVVVVSSFSNSNSVYADGVVETIKDSLNNTATAEMLLKVGDYQDVQSILDGVVTRNVGVKVLDGTENWSDFSSYYALSAGNIATGSILCTHFQNDPNFGIIVVSARFRAYVASIYTTLDSWKQYLAEQYAAGTPVIVIYPLATATTESVTGQTLQVQAGDNTLEITQASMTGLELEAQYQKRT